MGANEAVAGTMTTISTPALECPSRICLMAGATRAPSSNKSFCTDRCETSSDCEGETGGPDSGLCQSGFVCMWPTTTGAFRCEKMCVCRDFVVEPTGGFKKPAVCE